MAISLVNELNMLLSVHTLIQSNGLLSKKLAGLSSNPP